ncbi:glycosyltransferase [Psychroserpens sp.]
MKLNNNKINITFILPSLGAGGAERVMSFVAQNIDATKFNTTLLITDFEKNNAFSVTGITTIYLNKTRVLNAIPSLFKYVLNTKPDIVISAIGHVNTVMAYISIFAPKTKFVSREVNILSLLKSYELKSNFLGSFLSKRRFRYFDKIVCQSIDMRDDLKNNLNVSPDNLIVINNPITDNFTFNETSRKNNSILHFITVARLKKQKGHERIIQVLKKLDFPFHYTIIGDGPEKESIFNDLKTANLLQHVTHIENTKDVTKYLNENDLYLQGSFVEGFPNAVIESSAVGTPIIAFNAPGGINEIIEEGVNGFIVENEKDFINRLKNINEVYPFKNEEVSDCVMKKYHKEIIIKKYEDMFLSLMN